MYHSGAAKACRGCGLVLSLDCYSPDRRNKDGLQGACKPCQRGRVKASYNPSRVREYNASYRVENRERRVDYDAGRVERIRELAREKWANDDGTLLAKGAEKRARRLKATPPWADQAAIRAVYEMSRAISRFTGIPHDVDHFEPLQGKDVCGLHVHYNLRVIPASENRSKGNKRVAPAA